MKIKLLLLILLCVGLAEAQNPGWTSYPSPRNITVIAIDSSGNKWIGTQQSGTIPLMKFDGSNWSNIDTSKIWGYVQSIYIDKNNNIWIGTEVGLSKFNGSTWQRQIKTGSFKGIAQDKNNNLWFGTGIDGLLKYDGVNWTQFKTSNSQIQSNSVNAVAVDSNNNIWIGYSNLARVSKFTGTTWQHFFSNFDPIDPPFSRGWSTTSLVILQQDSIFSNSVYIGRQAGGDTVLTKLTDGQYEYWFTDFFPSIKPSIVYKLVQEGNYLWIGTDKGLIKLRNQWNTKEYFTTANSALTSNNIRSVAVDKNNVKWIVTDNTLYKYDDTPFLSLDAIPDSLRSVTNYSIKWQSGFLDKIKIEYSTTDGSTWNLIATDINASQGSYTWQVAVVAPSSSQCKIKISNAVDAALLDESSVFTIYTKVLNPVFSINAGTYNTSQTVTITSSTGSAEIRYTLNGSEPTQSSQLYSQSIKIDSSQNLKARAFKTDWSASDIISATYTLLVSNPIVSLNSGTYGNSQSVSITTPTDQAEIRYTLDGSEPIPSSLLYSQAIKIDSSQTLRTRVFRPGWVYSDIISRTYILKAVIPTFDPIASSYSTPQSVSISSASDSVKIYFTLDGNEPSESSTLYTSPILIDTNKVLKAKAFKKGWVTSDTRAGNYTINGQIFTVNFNTPSIWFDVNFDGKESKTINPTIAISYGSIVAYEWRVANKIIGTTSSVNAELPTGTWYAVLSMTSDRGIVKKDSVKISVYAAEATTTGSIESAVSQLSENIYFVTSKGGSIYRFDSTGVIAWTIQTGGSIQSTTCISSQDNIYVGSNDTRLYSFDYQGSPRWDKSMGGTIISSPSTSSNGLIYVGITTGRMFALDEAGTIKWNVQTGGAIQSSPSIDENGVVYFGSNDGKLYAVSSDGTTLWNYISGGSIRTSPALGLDSSIIFGSDDGFLYKIDRNGNLKWKYQTGGEVKSSPIIGLDGIIYFGSGDGKVYSLSKEGNKLWEFNAGSAVNVTPALSIDGTIYFGALNGTIFALDQNGNRKWLLQTGKPIIAPMLVTNSKTIMVGDTLGKVYIMKIPAEGSLENLTSGFIASTKTISAPSYEWWTFKGNNQRTGYRKNIVASVKNLTNKIPEKYALRQNYPNPFNPTTIIEYDLPKDSRVKIIVFDMLGRHVRTLVSEEKPGGSYRVEFDANKLSSGVYFYQLQTNEFSQTKKFILMR